MALAAATVWEVRTTGSATNGGGFKAGATGTDWSQQDSPQYSVTDAVTAGTTTITSATANFGTDVVGNILYIQGGTGAITAGWYEITARTDASTITVDRSTGLTAGTGATLKIGGALDSPATLAPIMVSSNKAFIKSGTYSLSAVATFSAASVSPASTVPATNIIGYASTRGDITPYTSNQSSRPIIEGTTSAMNVLTFSNNGWWVQNLVVRKGGAASSIASGLNLPGSNCRVTNCKVSDSTSNGIIITGNGAIAFCEVTGATGGTAINGIGLCVLINNYVHDCTGMTAGLNSSSASIFVHNIIANIAGANAGGIYSAYNGGVFIYGNTIYKAGRDGIRIDVASMAYTFIQNNIITECGAYAINQTTAAWPAAFGWDGNAFYSNTSGNRRNIDDTSTNAVDGVSPYTNTKDVVLSADPFVDKTTNDFRLNTATGGGALLRGTGVVNTFPTLTYQSYADMGAVEVQAGSVSVVSW